MNNVEFITLKEKVVTDFAKARNELLGRAKSEWVFFVDSDEIVGKELRKEVLKRIQNDKGYNGFYIRRKIYFLGKYIGTDKVLRLAKKDAGRWRRAVHEIWEAPPPVGMLKNYLVHNTADNLYDYIDKINYYSTIHSGENIKEGKHTNIFKMIFFPKVKFIQNLLMGRGCVFSMLQSFHSFLAWAKQYE